MAAELAARDQERQWLLVEIMMFESSDAKLDLTTLGQVSRVDTVVDVAVPVHRGGGALLAGATRAHGDSQVRLLVADHGAGVVWRVVRGGADGLASGAIDGDTGWIVGVVLHRGNDAHAARREGIAVDVGDIVVDLAVGPGELELGDGPRRTVIGRELDGDADAFLAVCLTVAAFELRHVGRVALAD